jgi:hypothetical protein
MFVFVKNVRQQKNDQPVIRASELKITILSWGLGAKAKICAVQNLVGKFI